MPPPTMPTMPSLPSAPLRQALRRRCPHSSQSRSLFSWISDSSSSDKRSGSGISTPTTDSPPPEDHHVHVPVMLHETVGHWVAPVLTSSSSSASTRRRFFVDGTTGFGGHSRELLHRHPEAHLLCIDRDPEVLRVAQRQLQPFAKRVAFHVGSYADMERAWLQRVGFPDEVDGICVDLGANSFHFDAARRGFSLLRDGPLDMRYNQEEASRPTAAEALHSLSEVQLTRIFREFGEERLAKEYAKAIVRDRDERGIVFAQTSDLRECIERIARKWSPPRGGGRRRGGAATTSGGGGGGVHPATKCFQALRIHVNDELQHVSLGVERLVTHLAPQGRLTTIAFHSLEDRPIKRLFRRLDTAARRMDDDEYEDYFDEDLEAETEAGAETDVLQRLGAKRFRLVKRKAIKAKKDEVESNPRSRSARLRCLERTI